MTRVVALRQASGHDQQQAGLLLASFAGRKIPAGDGLFRDWKPFLGRGQVDAVRMQPTPMRLSQCRSEISKISNNLAWMLAHSEPRELESASIGHHRQAIENAPLR